MKALLLLLCLALTACSTVSPKQSAALSRSVYATEKALKAGRYDLAASYSAQSIRLVPPPKKTPTVSPVESKGIRYVVLPQEQGNAPALSIGSQALTTLLSDSKAVARQFEAERKDLAKVEKEADSVLIRKEEVLRKAETAQVVKEATFWHRCKVWGSFLAVGAVLAALIAFVPAALPALRAAGSFIVRFLRRILQ